MRALENTSLSKLRLAPRLESPFASRALHATLAARRTRRVNREVARYDGAWSRTHAQRLLHRLPDIPSAEKGWIRHDHAEGKAACACGHGRKKKKEQTIPLRRPPVQSQDGRSRRSSCPSLGIGCRRRSPRDPVSPESPERRFTSLHVHRACFHHPASHDWRTEWISQPHTFLSRFLRGSLSQNSSGALTPIRVAKRNWVSQELIVRGSLASPFARTEAA
jgi:hypothetical protein